MTRRPPTRSGRASCRRVPPLGALPLPREGAGSRGVQDRDREPERPTRTQEMKAFMKKLADIRKNEDPRMSFTTPEFKDAQRQFQDQFKARSRAQMYYFKSASTAPSPPGAPRRARRLRAFSLLRRVRRAHRSDSRATPGSDTLLPVIHCAEKLRAPHRIRPREALSSAHLLCNRVTAHSSHSHSRVPVRWAATAA